MSNKKGKESYISSDKNNNFRLNKKANQSKIRNAKRNKEFLQESDNLVGELPSGAYDIKNKTDDKYEVNMKKDNKNVDFIDDQNNELNKIEEDEYETYNDNYFEPVEYKG